MSPGRWTEHAPLGPHPAGDVGGDVHVGTALCRRWSRPIPNRPGHQMVITVNLYACEHRGRRWVQTQIEFATTAHTDEDPEPNETIYEDGMLDGPAGEAWPTDDDIRAELAGYPIEIHNEWDGS